MFSRSTPVASPSRASTPAPTITAPVPQAVATLPLDDNELRAYTRTAEAVGFRPAALLETQVLALLQQRGIPTYAYDEMARYLTAKARAQGQCWFWRPLRAQDVGTWAWGEFYAQSGGSHANDWYRPDHWACRPYHRAIPLRVLARVEMIAGAFGEAVKFFVTDMATAAELNLSHRPDPFICVTALDMRRIVFDVWDEPGFMG